MSIGKSGFRAIMVSITKRTDYLAESLLAIGRFELLSKAGGSGLPLVAWRLTSAELYDGIPLRKCEFYEGSCY